jgi:hypothetical protein
MSDNTEALKRLRDAERQSPVGREIISKMLNGDDVTIAPPPFQINRADDDRPIDADH